MQYFNPYWGLPRYRSKILHLPTDFAMFCWLLCIKTNSNMAYILWYHIFPKNTRIWLVEKDWVFSCVPSMLFQQWTFWYIHLKWRHLRWTFWYIHLKCLQQWTFWYSHRKCCYSSENYPMFPFMFSACFINSEFYFF